MPRSVSPREHSSDVIDKCPSLPAAYNEGISDELSMTPFPCGCFVCGLRELSLTSLEPGHRVPLTYPGEEKWSGLALGTSGARD